MRNAYKLKMLLHRLNKPKDIFIHIRYIFLLIIPILLILYAVWKMGFINPTKESMLWYFEKNQSDFASIVEYFNDNPDEMGDYLSIETKLWSDIDDKSISLLAMKMFVLGNYDSIWSHYNSNGMVVEFRISNFIVDVGEPISIVYSETDPTEKTAEIYDFVKRYELICKNWYFCYRGKNLPQY